MIDRIDPQIRRELTASRCLAMRGEVGRALSLLENRSNAEERHGRRLEYHYTTMLRAELLHLNEQAEAAAALFQSAIVPNLTHLAKEIGLVAGYNQAEVNFDLLRPAGDYYSLVDQARAVGFRLTDADAVLSAEAAAARGDHHQALPAFWREVVRTYRQGCWMASRWASVRLAREYLQVRMPQECAWQAVLALDHELAKQAASHLLEQRNVPAIRATVEKLLANANLLRHFSVACTLISGVADGVPDDLVDGVAGWLLPRCSLPSSRKLAQGAMYKAWEALDPIGCRLSSSCASEVVRVAVGHPRWTAQTSGPNGVLLEREKMVETLTRVAHALEPEERSSLADHVIPLATDRMLNHDYPDVINLLCHIAEGGDSELKSRMGDQLFVPGQPRSYLLGQVAELFGKPFLSPERLASAAEQVRQWVLLQVQRLPVGQDAQPCPGTVATATSTLGTTTTVVNVTSTVELEAIARHQKDLPDEVVRRLVSAVMAMIRERENALVNRAALISTLPQFASRLDGSLVAEVLDDLIPLARGEAEEPTLLPSASSAEDPFNPRKVMMGKPSQVRGAALVALARLGSGGTPSADATIDSILEDALCDPDSEVRRAAFTAVHCAQRLAEGPLMAVLLGLRDSDPNTAANAFFVLALKSDLRLTRAQWRLFVHAARIAAQSPELRLRAAAAAALTRLQPSSPTGGIRNQTVELQRTLATDCSATVRREATSGDRGRLG